MTVTVTDICNCGREVPKGLAGTHAEHKYEGSRSARANRNGADRSPNGGTADGYDRDQSSGGHPTRRRVGSGRCQGR